MKNRHGRRYPSRGTFDRASAALVVVETPDLITWACSPRMQTIVLPSFCQLPGRRHRRIDLSRRIRVGLFTRCAGAFFTTSIIRWMVLALEAVARVPLPCPQYASHPVQKLAAEELFRSIHSRYLTAGSGHETFTLSSEAGSLEGWLGAGRTGIQRSPSFAQFSVLSTPSPSNGTSQKRGI